jgi:hypothetical protein
MRNSATSRLNAAIREDNFLVREKALRAPSKSHSGKLTFEIIAEVGDGLCVSPARGRLAGSQEHEELVH